MSMGANASSDNCAVTTFAVFLFPPAQALFRLSCRRAYLAPNITTLPSCQVLRWQASRPPHPLPTRRSPSPDAVMLRITPSGLPGLLPSAPKGAPSCFIVPQSRRGPSLRDGTVTALGFGFLSSFAPATGRPRFVRTPRSRAHFPSPPGRRRRPLCGDCFAPAACRTFPLSPSRQTSLRSDCPGRTLSQRSP